MFSVTLGCDQVSYEEEKVDLLSVGSSHKISCLDCQYEQYSEVDLQESVDVVEVWDL